jgi:hypothetical protein
MRTPLTAALIIALGVLAVDATRGQAQPSSLAPPAESRRYFAPFEHAITLDGNLDDWAGVPTVTTTDGQKPNGRPDDDGSVTFAATADAKNLYFMARVPDKTIVANTGRDPWQEDSVEFYLNATRNLNAPRYGRGIAQVTVPAANIGVPVDRAKISGINGAGTGARAFVFKTLEGYAMEVSVPLENDVWRIQPTHGLTLGFEVQLNGSSGGVQDSILNWVYRAGMPGHPSNTPGLFGQLVFYRIGETTMPTVTAAPTDAVPAPPPGSVEQTTASYRQGSGKTAPQAGVNPPTTRDPRVWPFSRSSIWNTPLGGNAVYVPAKLEAAAHFAFDQDLYFESPANAPWRALHPPAAWERRCGAASPDNQRGELRLGDDVFVADSTAAPFQTPNNAAAILQPDGRTLVQLEPMTRCTRGAEIYGYRTTDQDLYGDGLWGGHLGSGLSSIGGALRHGELIGPGRVRHALKLKLWAKKYLTFDPASATPGFRWPAIRADSGAGDKTQFNAYGTMEPALSNPVRGLVMGSLLAIPPNVSLEGLGIPRTLKLYPVIEKLFHALQDYGGYIDDNTGWDAHYFGAEYGVNEEIQNVYGEPLENGAAATLEAINKLFTALALVSNNSPASVGGGGLPRVAPAPDFARAPSALPYRALERKGWTVDAFASDPRHPAAHVLDRTAGTYWRSGRAQGPYQDLRVDMGAAHPVQKVRLISGAFGSAAYHLWPRDFLVETSTDGKTWRVVGNAAGAPVTEIVFKPTKARFVRFTQMNQDANDWAISDLQIYE